MNVIVVDDSLAMRRILTRALEGQGWSVQAASHGGEALALLDTLDQCDLILTDWHMPEMDGLELCRRVRGHARHSGVRILMVTSDGCMESIGEALAAGANDFVIKPFTSEALVERITEVLGV